ncbi:PQQ-dependent sugar dehydrogenase [Chryseolinea sp. T2]|uniref:PQQ-dependent sugar dehydrogenase n=1 Tax=Chryseolinea sp. T2 TaxID=3129255 RepID=UPI003078003A
MRRVDYLFAAALTFVAIGCNYGSSASGYDRSAPSVQADTTLLPPLEKNPPNTKYRPAFPGQTRINGVKTITPYQVDQLAEDLGRPWAIILLPDERFLLTEKTGFMQIRNADGSLVKKITGLPKVDDRDQGGLLDVALDPNYSTNRIIYWSYSEPYKKGNVTAVGKGKLNEASGSVENPVVIFRATPEHDNSTLHYGSRLIFDKDGNLFVSAGERARLDGRAQAQMLNSGLGKVFKITKDGKPAPGNPFIGRTDAMPEIYSYGHRNPQSLDIHPVTGDLWEAEFGPRGGDELNLVKAGKNYGWPTITFGLEYSGKKIGDSLQQKAGMEQPVYYWDPVHSPGGMVFYKGKAIPEWENCLFIGGLGSNRIARLVIKNNKVVGEEWLLADKQERFRDIAYHNGMLFAVTDGGKLYRIRKK